jgi:hypothetical protein
MGNCKRKEENGYFTIGGDDKNVGTNILEFSMFFRIRTIVKSTESCSKWSDS